MGLGSVGKCVAAAILVAVTLSGCVTEKVGTPECGVWRWTETSRPYRPEVLASCERDGDGWILQDMTLTGDMEIHIPPTSHMTFRNFHVEQAGDVRIDVGCGCTLQGEDFVVTAGEGAGHLALVRERDGFVQDTVLDGLVAVNVGISYWDAAGHNTLSNITLQCDWPGGFGLGSDVPGSSFTLRDVHSKGCAGISMGSREAIAIGPVLIERVHLDGLNMGGGVFGAADSWYNATIIDSSIANVPNALDARGKDRLTLQNVTISGSEMGLGISEGATLIMSDSTFEDNVKGINAWDDSRLEITHSRFLRNRDPGPIRPCDGAGAITGSFTGFMHQSVIEGNSVGLAGGNNFDATQNYWGSSAGPTPQRDFMCPAPVLPSAGGDSVSDLQSAIPYLSSPP